MEHYEQEISQFIDNELPADMQKELFTHLADCEKCRRTLSDFMEMKKESKTFYENIDVDLSSGMNFPVKGKQEKGRSIYKPLFYFSAAAAIILGILFLMKLSNINKLESQYSSIKEKYNWLSIMYKGAQSDNMKIQAPENGRDISKKSETSATDKKSIVKKNNNENQKQNMTGFLAVNKLIKHNTLPSVNNKYLKQVRRSPEIKVVQVTKNDFLTPQIIGN